MDPGVSVQKQNFTKKTQRSLQKFLEPNRKPKVIYTDNSLEFGKACEDLSWNHCTSTPHRSETNGIAEKAVRRVKEGTSAVLLQSGRNESWWADSMVCYTYLRNVTDLLSDGKTSYERRFGQPFKGPIIHWLSHPKSGKDQSRIHQFGKKVLPGLFLGYALYAGCIWKCDVLVADLEELETMDASEIYAKRLNAKEVIFPKQGEFIFPIADGRIKLPGGDQEMRIAALIRERPIRGEGHFDFLGESEGSLPQPHDSLPDAGEAINDFWSMSGNFIFRHDVEPRVKLYSPREESFPIPLKYIDVSRTTHTNLDVKQERRIDDYWDIDGSRDLSDSWTGFTQFALFEEKAPDGYMWSGERLTRKQLTSRPGHLWPELWERWESTPSLRRRKSGHMKNQNSIMQENYEEFISLTLRTRSSKKPFRRQEENWKHQWLPLCFARRATRARIGRPVARLMISNRNLPASWKPVNPQDCVWKTLYRIIMRTILQEKGTVHCNITIWFTN